MSSYYRHEIDGLRAVAVGAVLANHFFAGLFPNGFLGVDIFFVISGFVITASLQGRSRQRLGQFLVEFYTRRVKRLFPALAACVLVTSLLICLVNPSASRQLMAGIFALFGLANIYFYVEANDYFGDSASLNPFTHTWSLGVEEQFYFVFPLLFWLGINMLQRRVAIWVGGVLLLASVISWVVVQNHDSLAAFYIAVFRFWQIGLGVLAWLCQDRLQMSLASASRVKGAAVLVAAGIVLLPETLPLIAATSGAVLGTTIFLMLTAPIYRPNFLLVTRPMSYVGKISYSLYLWHWPVAVMLKWTLGLSAVTAAAGVAVSLALAHLSYTYLESPLRHIRWARAPGRELLVGLSVIVGLAAVLVGNREYLRVYFYQGQQPDVVALGAASLTRRYEGDAVWSGAPCVLSANSQVGKQINPAECAIGVPLDRAERRVLVIGNSFSAAFAAAFDLPRLPGEPETSFILTSSWGAPTVAEIPSSGPWSLANDYYWDTVIPGLLSRLLPGDRLLIASDLARFSPALAEPADAEMFTQLEAGLRRLSGELAASGVGLAMIGPLPFAREAECDPAVAIPQWYAPSGGPCRYLSRAETLHRQEPLTMLLDRLAAENIIALVDVFDIFCPGETCGYINPDGILMYRDASSHPTVEAAQLVRPVLSQWLQAPFAVRADIAGTNRVTP